MHLNARLSTVYGHAVLMDANSQQAAIDRLGQTLLHHGSIMPGSPSRLVLGKTAQTRVRGLRASPRNPRMGGVEGRGRVGGRGVAPVGSLCRS